MTVTNRGVKNANERGSSYARRARKDWLLETYAANVKLIRATMTYMEEPMVDHFVISVETLLEYEGVVEAIEVPTCRCYRCGRLLWFETLTVDRIIPGCLGGTYRRNNIRPACYDCNTETGAALSNRPDLKVAKKRAAKKKAAVKAKRGLELVS